jgi:phage-related protein
METVELTPDEGGSGDITPGDDIGVTETVVTLPEKVIESSYASVWPFKRTACLDMSDRFTDTRYGIDPADLRAVAQKFVDDNALGVPRVSLEVGYLSIKNELLGSQADSANTVHLGDTVTIRFRELGIETKEKVVKTVYNVLQDRWESVTIGTQMDDLAETLSSLQIGTDVIN